MAEIKFPTETITLPSKGLGLYPESSLWSKGEVQMKYMGTKEEDILTNTNFISQGIVMEKLLESMIQTPGIILDEVLVGDKNALLVAARILGHGSQYPVTYFVNGKAKQGVVELSKLENKKLDETLFNKGNLFKFVLPKTKVEVEIKLLTQKDEKLIEKEITSLKKIFPEGSFDVSTRYRYMIQSVNGNKEKSVINEFIDTSLVIADSKSLREFYISITPDIDMTWKPEDEDYTGEGIEIRPGIDFFWPESGL